MTERFRSILSREWDYQMQQFPEWASSLGDRRWNDKWTDNSLEAIKQREEHYGKVLIELSAIERTQLPERDRLDYDLFRKDYQSKKDELAQKWYLLPLDHIYGPQSAHNFASDLRFQTPKDFEDWIERLRGFSKRIDQTIVLMRRGIEAKMQHPKVLMQRVPEQLERHIVEDAEKSLFYNPFRQRPPAIGETEFARLREVGKDAIQTSIVPAFKRLREFFVSDYLPSCPEQVGVWQMPRGAEIYQHYIRLHTSTELSPEQIHQIGLAEVKRIRTEMEQIKDKVGFRGTLDEFFHHLRTDSRFYYKTSQELLDAYRAISKRIDGELYKVFDTFPRMPYGVTPIPMEMAPTQTTAYYSPPAADGTRPGQYFVNLYKPEARPKWEMMALSLHEAVPGHHFQIARAMELGELPNFRKYASYTAYVEGWALYAEALGDEMGLYDDPYSKFGQLTYEMWRAVRLVVDTGIHSMRWDRQKAIDFFKENAPKTELDITNEIDRYIAWPGQALAYKVGELKIKELRSRAESRLGNRFNLKTFHNILLESGAVPLDVLEALVDAWIERQSQH